MNLKLVLPAVVLAGGLAFSALPGMANPTGQFGALKGVGMNQPPVVEKTLLGWRRGCHWGFGGYHKYVPGVGRVQCTSHKCWTNSFGIRRCRWF